MANGTQTKEQHDIALLHLLYERLFGRSPDEGGFSHFKGLIANGMSYLELMSFFLDSDECKKINGASTFVPIGHYYSPIVAVDEADVHMERIRNKKAPLSLPDISLDREFVLSSWNNLVPYIKSAPFPEQKTTEFRYTFGNNFFGYGDGVVLHSIIRHYKPKRIIEVGSGWSSANMVDTVERYLSSKTKLTFIEPHTERLDSLLIPSPKCEVNIIKDKVQNVPISIYEELEAGDIFFIDSTHIVKTGSDVCFELFEILPKLKPGVLVHVHDIFWPFEYPEDWVLVENRSWNELYALRAFLMNNKDWRIVMFGDYLVKTAREVVEKAAPAFISTSGGSIWIERVS